MGPEDEAMVADMQRATGMDYDEVVRLLREYKTLKRDDDDAGDGGGGGVDQSGSEEEPHGAPEQPRYRRESPVPVDSPRHPSATSGASVPCPMPPPSAEGFGQCGGPAPSRRAHTSSVTLPPGEHPLMPATSAAEDARRQKRRLDEQLDDLLGDISASRDADEIERREALLVIEEHKAREAARAAAAKETHVRRGPVETPASLKTRNGFVDRYEAESELRRAQKEEKEQRKREAAALEAEERRAKGIFVNMALKKKIAAGSHLPRKGAGAGSAKGQLTRDLRAIGDSPRGGKSAGTSGRPFVAIDLDEDGLPVLLDE
jgi:hypothetical protein